MLQVINIAKFYGSETVLKDVSFVVNPGERVGLVGPNGSGKSTLLRIVAGIEPPDSGRVAIGSGVTTAWMPQGFEADPAQTLGQAVRGGLIEHAKSYGRQARVEARMARASGQELDALIEEYGRASDEFAALGGYEVEYRTGAVLEGLGLGGVPEDTPLSSLSGGERTRVGLAGVIAANPGVLLLDEPTNHLDIEALEWLESFLSGYPGAALIASHDRAFLDGAVTGILELSNEAHGIAAYPGGYSQYRLMKERDLEKQTAAWKDQEAETRRIQGDITRTKQTALRTERSTTHDFYRRRAKKVARKAKVRERRLERLLTSSDRVERPSAAWKMKLDFGAPARGGTLALRLDGVGHGYAQRRLFQDVDLVLEHGERVALLGPNGSGKSTLLGIVAGLAAPDLGAVRVGANVRIGYMPQDQAGMDWSMTPLEMVRLSAEMTETEARTLLHLYLFEGDESLLAADKLSYGQRSRLLLAKLVLEGANFLVLDEPVNHLDIPSRERFEQALDAYPGSVLMAVHDRDLIDRFATAIWSIEDGAIRRYEKRGEVGAGLRRGGSNPPGGSRTAPTIRR